MIRAVLFDVDGVLLDSKRANVAFYRALMRRFGYEGYSDAELERGHSLTLLEAIASLTGEPEERVRQIWEVARRLEDYPFDLLILPAGCEAALTSLAQQYRLGIVTGRIRDGVEHFFDFSGLRDRFSVAVAYEDYSRPKPDAEPLLKACERLGVAARETVYVGDAPADYLCARAAGTGFIAYGDAIEDAPRVARSFAEIEPLLKALDDD